MRSRPVRILILISILALWWREQYRKANVKIPSAGDFIGRETWQNYLDSPIR